MELLINKRDITIPEEVIQKWQSIVNIMAELLGVPAAFIMKVDPPYIEVFRSSESSKNPYKVGGREHLTGLYCEQVIKTRSKLLVPNTLKDKHWDKNPDIKLGMISYLGFPLLWPDDEVFGTICVLDLKENPYNKAYEQLMLQFKELVEAHLGLLYDREHLEDLVEQRTTGLKKATEELQQEITERKQAEKALRRTYEDLEGAHRQLEESEAQLIQTEKMSALGTLVAGTAHELNNPITAVLNFSAHCRKHTSKDDELYPVLEDIEHEAKHCTEIVQNLLTFSHTEKDDDKAYEKESLAEILGRVLKLLSYRIEKQRILVTQHIADDTPEIWMKPNNIQQLILNLATNAFDALEDSEKKELNVDIHREGKFVQMTIADTGSSIAAESLGAIFYPFFTTKPVGHGTGLGLSVSQGIIKAHGGQITCESEPAMGTKFTVLLPIERSK